LLWQSNAILSKETEKKNKCKQSSKSIPYQYTYEDGLNDLNYCAVVVQRGLERSGAKIARKKSAEDSILLCFVATGRTTVPLPEYIKID
jgi:hypothetical protein